ncbi:HupE/UreJ family protein [Candidatus Thioglobus autotrophicus]|uniref:HupE/UreJ family protein n=1 Tax=Candidatus Thioglobus autotrophicus TaxID=1705394 RepID=UPI00299E0266|nr:HupE/UreJ family protein [Candidatus Thioglobus autotrophicus]WPE18237.1 HupE/UreJ family protein [Candidatus Thioglobus autotrophicus]
MKLLSLLLLLINISVQADVVKPALVEVTIFNNKTLEVTIDLSLEAAMSGIGTQYKNTTDSPNSQTYDQLRSLEPEVLRERFKAFEVEFLNSLELSINHQAQVLTLTNAKIDIVGYKKRPRKTVLTYQTPLDEWPKTLTWQYGKIHGDSALRWQIYKQDEYNWSQWQWLRDGSSSGVIDINHPESQSATQRFFQFIDIGFDHVIPLGWDHILFIIGMALSSLLWRRLLLLVSVFTLAHTLTLGLAMVGVLEISTRIVEPLIAFSIAYVAIENLLVHQSIKRKTIVVFIFGLIHGLGFASMLKNFEMAPDSFATTLIGFNIGVELAQVVIVIGVVGVLLILRRLRLNYRQLAIIPISILIALIGFWWGVERLIG